MHAACREQRGLWSHTFIPTAKTEASWAQPNWTMFLADTLSGLVAISKKKLKNEILLAGKTKFDKEMMDGQASTCESTSVPLF